MRNWTADDLDTIGATAEVDVAPLRPDGSLRPSTPIWIVRVGDDLYVRSYRGRRGSWFHHYHGNRGRLQRYQHRDRRARSSGLYRGDTCDSFHRNGNGLAVRGGRQLR